MKKRFSRLIGVKAYKRHDGTRVKAHVKRAGMSRRTNYVISTTIHGQLKQFILSKIKGEKYDLRTSLGQGMLEDACVRMICAQCGGLTPEGARIIVKRTIAELDKE